MSLNNIKGVNFDSYPAVKNRQTQNKSNMQINIIKEFLKCQEWQFTQVEGKNLLLFGIGGKNGNFQCIADLID